MANHTTSKQQKQGRTLPVATWCLCTAHSIMCVLCATGEMYRLKSSVSIIIVNLSKKVGFHKISSFGTQARQQIYANNFPNSQALPSNNESPALTKILEWTPSPVIINKTNPAVAIEPWNLKFHKRQFQNAVTLRDTRSPGTQGTTRPNKLFHIYMHSKPKTTR